MKQSKYEFDPNGDVELVLETSPRPFVFDWADGTLSMQPKPIGSEEESDVEDEVEEDAPGRSRQPPPQFSESCRATTQDCLGEFQLLNGKTQVRMLVSSRHLTLASPVFRTMLDGPFEKVYLASGRQQITASDWDVDAMVILLDIIHGHNKAVPRSLKLPTLARIATIVDYYECHEIVEVFGEIWLLSSEDGWDTGALGLGSMLWLLVAWTFSHAEMFEEMTRMAILESKGPIEVVDLPIPEDILSKSSARGHLEGVFQYRKNNIADGLQVRSMPSARHF